LVTADRPISASSTGSRIPAVVVVVRQGTSRDLVAGMMLTASSSKTTGDV